MCTHLSVLMGGQRKSFDLELICCNYHRLEAMMSCMLGGTGLRLEDQPQPFESSLSKLSNFFEALPSMLG